MLRNSSVRFGFSLVEVLAVIAVLGVLCWLTFSLLQSAQRTATRTQSASILRNLTSAALTYSVEHGGEFPKTGHSTGDIWANIRAWNGTLRPYLGDDPAAFVCPDDPHYDTRIRRKTSSFTMNGYLDPGTYPQWGKPSLLSEPGSTMLFYYQARRSGYVFRDHTHASSWPGSWTAVTSDIAPDWFCDEERNASHTRGFSYYGFADGHIESIDAQDFRRFVATSSSPALPSVDLSKR